MIKKFVFGLILAMLILIGAVSLFVYTNKDVIIHEMTMQLESSGLDVEIREMDLHFWKSFPHASASINGFSLATLDHQPILTANQLSFNLELMKLLSGQMEVTEIVIRDGHIHLHRDKKGQTNYQFGPATNSEKKFNDVLQLNSIELKQMAFTYLDEKQHHLIRLKDIDAILHPKINGDIFETDVNLQAFGELLSIDGLPYFKKQGLQINSKLRLESAELSFQNTQLTIAETKLNFDGDIQHINSATPTINFVINDGQGRVENLSKFLPENWFQQVEHHQAKGEYNLQAKIHGKLGVPAIPKIDINAQLSDISLQHETLKHGLEDGSGKLAFQYGHNRQGKIKIHDFVARYESEDISVDFELISFDHPQTTTLLNGELFLKDLNPDVIPDFLVYDAGRIRLEEFNIETSEKGLTYQGRIHASGVEGLFSGVGFSVSEGMLDADGHQLTLSPTKLTSLGGAHLIQGILDLDAQSYDITIQSDMVDLSRFFETLTMDSSPEAKNVELTNRPKDKTTIHLQADNMQYDDIKFEKTTAEIIWSNNKLQLKSQLAYCDGLVDCAGNYNSASGKGIFNVDCHDVNIHSIFNEWNNFGQEQIQANHIAGIGDVQSMIQFDYTSGKPFNPTSLQVIGGIHIVEGELIDVPIFKQFASYIHQKDLSHIRFRSLNNVFKISNGRFYLPEMFIQSNAANIIVAGHQTLDNDLNYAIKINAGQVLTKKIKRHNARLKPIPARNRGFFNLHYLIRGPLADFEYFTNKREVNDKLEQSLFLRDEIIQKLSLQFDTTGLYQSPHLIQDIPEMDDKVELEVLPGFD